MTALFESLALVAALGGAPTPELALTSSLDQGTRLELSGLRAQAPRDCQPTSWEAPRGVGGSGAVALRFEGKDAAGRPCNGWAWANVRVFRKALGVIRSVSDGEKLYGAVKEKEIEVQPGLRTLSSLPEGATASHELRGGATLTDADVRVGPRPGEPVVVVVRVGDIELSQDAHAVPCEHGLACALVSGGKRVEGRFTNGHIEVEAP